MDKLKPCPFCGGEATFIGDTSSIKCKTCGGAFICTNPLISTIDAKEARNKRADNVQEVVRCKDCIYANTCKLHRFLGFNADDYCSYSKRMDGE